MHRKLFLFLLLATLYSCQGKDQKVDSYSQFPRPNILFLIADDWSFPHAGVFGDKVVRTPTFDRLADEGTLFLNAFTAAPSCSPSRAAILTGMYPHELGGAGNLWSVFPKSYPNWVNLLEEAGYHTGKTRKGWGPGDFESGGYTQNPAGKQYNNFHDFLKSKPADKPFSFWFGSSDPHRVYETNAGIRTGMRIEDVEVPGFMPDVECVRNDILDYYYEVERFDRECGNILRQLEEAGELENTFIIMTSDNGMPFPRAKANLYDYGTRMPFVVWWGGRIDQTPHKEFVNFIDIAPTLLDVAGLDIPDEMSGRSLRPLFGNEISSVRNYVFLERERHANVRKGDLSYPMRAVRNHDYLYIKNFFPERWPAGDPTVHQAVGQYGDVDNSITKYLIMDSKNKEGDVDYFNLSFGKRPMIELYDVKNDPYQLTNLANDPELEGVRDELAKQLEDWMEATDDPRFHDPQTIFWDTVRYVPNYQFKDYDYISRINEYRIKPPTGQASREGIPCTQ